MESEAETLRAARARAAGPAGSRRLLVLNAALGLLAFRQLLWPRLRGDLALDVESWLFVSAESSALSVLLLCTWLLYRRADRLRGLPRGAGAAACALGAGLALAGVGTAAWAALSGADHLLAVSLGLEALGFASLRGGAAGLRAVAVPVAFLAFALPLPPPLLNEVAFGLQLWTARYAGWLLYLLGVPALVSGDQILRPAATFAVIENCNGLRSMQTLAMLAVLMIDLFGRRGLHAALLLLLAPPLAFALNGLRVLALILNPHSEVVAIHNLQGVAILLGGLLGLYALDGTLARLLRPAPAPPARAGRPPAAAPRLALARAGPLLPPAFLAATALLGLALRPWPPPPSQVAVLRHEVPATLGEWSSRDLETDAGFLAGVSLRDAVHREYREGEDSVELFVAIGDHASGRRGPFSPKTALLGSGWVVEDAWTLELAGSGPRATARVLRRETRRQLVVHWAEGAGSAWAEAGRSWLFLDGTPWRRAREVSVVRLATPLRGPGPEARRQAEARITRFYRLLREPLARLDSRLARKTFSRFSTFGKRISAHEARQRKWIVKKIGILGPSGTWACALQIERPSAQASRGVDPTGSGRKV